MLTARVGGERETSRTRLIPAQGRLCIVRRRFASDRFNHDRIEPMPDREAPRPRVITPEAREVIQGVYAGAQDAGLKIAGLARVREVEDTLVGPNDSPTNLGPSVEIAISIDANGKPIPRVEDRTDGEQAEAVMIIRATPHQEFGGSFWRADVKIYDVDTAKLFYAQRSGATNDQWNELAGGRPGHEYADDPEFNEGVLALEAESLEQAAADAMANGVAGGYVIAERGWPDRSAGADDERDEAAVSDEGSAVGAESADPGGGLPFGITPLWLGGGIAGLVIAVIAVLTLGGGDESAADGASDGSVGTGATSEGNGASAGNPGGAPAGSAIAAQLLGQFEFLDDGVIEFAIEGDRIVGRTIRPPLSTGIDLVGGAGVCPEFAGDVVFDLDVDGVGDWFWFDSNPCVRLGTSGAVTVVFGVGGADASGVRSSDHPLADMGSLVLAMPRVSGVTPFTPRSLTVEDGAGDVRDNFAEFGCVDPGGATPTPRGDVIDILGASIEPTADGGYRVAVHFAAAPTSDPLAEVSYVLQVGSLAQRDASGDPPGSGPILGTIVWAQFHPFGGPANASGTGLSNPGQPWAAIVEIGETTIFEINRLPGNVDSGDLSVEVSVAFDDVAMLCADGVLIADFR